MALAPYPHLCDLSGRGLGALWLALWLTGTIDQDKTLFPFGGEGFFVCPLSAPLTQEPADDLS